jgi:hypothetical protein
MTQEPEKGGTIDVFHDNSGIEKNAPALLTDEEIKNQVFSSWRNGDKRANRGKNFTAKTDITMRHHRDQTRLPSGEELIELNEITRGSYRTGRGAIANCATNHGIFPFSMAGE